MGQSCPTLPSHVSWVLVCHWGLKVLVRISVYTDVKCLQFGEACLSQANLHLLLLKWGPQVPFHVPCQCLDVVGTSHVCALVE